MSIAKFNKWQNINGTVMSTVLQTQFFHITNAYTYSISGYVDTDTALTGTITPTRTDSKILIMIYSWWAAPQSSQHTTVKLKRTISGSSAFMPGATSYGNRPASLGGVAAQITNANLSQGDYWLSSSYMHYMDSPNTTSAITYTQTISGYSTSIQTLNKTLSDREGGTYDPRTTSSVILMEIAQ